MDYSENTEKSFLDENISRDRILQDVLLNWNYILKCLMFCSIISWQDKSNNT